jgi:hypothetical protein
LVRRSAVRRLVFFFVLLLIPAASQAAEPVLRRPHWSLELKGGYFYPDIENWKATYGSDRTTHLAGSLAYKILRQLEVGIEGGYISDKGQGLAPIHTQQAGVPVLGGSVKYDLAPLQAFVLLRGVFSENQVIVPYVGGGWTRMYYREKVENQPTARGSTDGYHGRAGIQILLDNIDPEASGKFYLDYGVDHTYFFIEAQSIHANVNDVNGVSVNLGGTSYLVGLLFEF